MAKKMSPAKEPDTVYVYVGPTVKGVVQNGAIMTGTRDAVLFRLRDAVERYPMIAELLVRDTELAAARKKIKDGGNALAGAYRTMCAAVK